MTNIIINLMIARIDALARRESEITRKLPKASTAAHLYYAQSKRDKLNRERLILTEMLKVYFRAELPMPRKCRRTWAA